MISRLIKALIILLLIIGCGEEAISPLKSSINATL